MTNHLGVDRCKNVLLRAQTCGSFSSKVVRLKRHHASAERRKKSPGWEWRGIFMGQLIPLDLPEVSEEICGEAGSWIQVFVLSGQCFNHRPILHFVEPLSYHLLMSSTASCLILSGSCILNS